MEQIDQNPNPGYPTSGKNILIAQAQEDARVNIKITTILETPLQAKLIFTPFLEGDTQRVDLETGVGSHSLAPGRYRVFIHAYQDEVPYLIDIQELNLEANASHNLNVELLEGVGGNRPLSAFDQDFDLALDRVELEAGTDLASARSIPGVDSFDWPSPILSDKGAWYRGELHAHSEHGRGKESVRQLIRRAQKQDLDFLAITDRNTFAAALDPDFKSKSMVLIPAMEWGSDERGLALLYAPHTFPEMTDSYTEAQAMVITVQAQGGIFAIAHPNFSIAPWQWGMNYFNAVEVWCRDWRVPSMTMDQLDQRWLARKDGRLIYSIAEAAATTGFVSNGRRVGISGNAQSTLFWDYELVRGQKSAAIAGSNSADPRVQLASPVTYIYGREKSLNGILEGLRKGRTFISRDIDGPTLEFQADVNVDGTIEVGMGGSIPMNKPSRLVIGVKGAKGAQLDVLLNGLPIRTRAIESNTLYYSMIQQPDSLAVYRVRVVKPVRDLGLGPNEVLAMSSPIYAEQYVLDQTEGGEDGWIQLDSNYEDPETWQNQLPGNPEQYELKTVGPASP